MQLVMKKLGLQTDIPQVLTNNQHKEEKKKRLQFKQTQKQTTRIKNYCPVGETYICIRIKERMKQENKK